MSYKEDFIMQWKELSAVIESNIIKQVKDGKDISTDSLNRALSLELNKWQNYSQYQGIWLNKLKKNNLSVGTKFENQLKKISFQNVKSPANASIIPYILITILIAIASYTITGYFKLAVWQIWGSTIVAPLFIGGSLLTIWKESNQKKKMGCKVLYMKQLEKYGAILSKLCEEAE